MNNIRNIPGIKTSSVELRLFEYGLEARLSHIGQVSMSPFNSPSAKILKKAISIIYSPESTYLLGATSLELYTRCLTRRF